ncbi:hypothetical protein BH09ACT10_BH09ACT10_13570 [soil metagenome]
MTTARRWCLVVLGVLLVIATPVALRSLPATGSDISASSLLKQIRASQSTDYSGVVESAGTLQLSVEGRFSSLADLLSGPTRMRVWWKAPDRWRVDTLRTSGETDLFRDPDGTTTWSYESERATRSVDVTVRLPNSADLLPPTLAARTLAGARSSEVSRIGAQRIAGVSAVGLRLDPADSASRIDHVDVWADPETGIPLRTEIYAAGETKPSIHTSFVSFSKDSPDIETLLFRPPPGVTMRRDDVVDIAAAADRFSDARPPATLAGLESREGTLAQAVGLYGRGATVLMAIPVWGRVARPLRTQLAASIGAVEDSDGVHLSTGPLGLLLTPRSRGGSWLLLGSVTDETLTKAAQELTR